MTAKEIEIGFAIPVIGISAKTKWNLDDAQRDAAWNIYIELTSRIAVSGFGHGLVREALSSYHALFVETRGILREYGRRVAQPLAGSTVSLGYIVLWMLNGEIRPILSKWHVRLGSYESSCQPLTSAVSHEEAWPDRSDCLRDLASLENCLRHYARLFERVLEVPSMIPKQGS